MHMFALGTLVIALASTITLWGDLKAGMTADEVRLASKSDAIVLSPYCSAQVRPTLIDGRLVAVELVAQSTQTSPEDKAQRFMIVPCETDFRRHLARQFGKAIDTSFMADEPTKIISRSRTYVRNCVVAQLYLSHVPERPSQIMFRVARDGEFSLKSGPDNNKPMDCHRPKS